MESLSKYLFLGMGLILSFAFISPVEGLITDKQLQDMLNTLNAKCNAQIQVATTQAQQQSQQLQQQTQQNQQLQQSLTTCQTSLQQAQQNASKTTGYTSDQIKGLETQWRARCDQRLQDLMHSQEAYYTSGKGLDEVLCRNCDASTCGHDENAFRKCLSSCPTGAARTACMNAGIAEGYLPESVRKEVLDRIREEEINFQNRFMQPLLMNNQYQFGQAVNLITSGLMAGLKAVYNRVNQNAPLAYQTTPQELLNIQREIQNWIQHNAQQPPTPQMSPYQTQRLFMDRYEWYVRLMGRMILLNTKMFIIYKLREKNPPYQSSRRIY